MDPFNIVIRRDGHQLALNIHPKNEAKYMVLFEGSLVGEVFMNAQSNTWEAHSAMELSNGEHPDYPCVETMDCEGLLLDRELVAEIGSAICQTLNLD